METKSELLDQLSRTAGVDLNGLRDKYRGIIQEEHAKKEKDVSAGGANVKPEDLAKLDNYKICKACLGKGTIKTIYNHMVLERDCEECDGESIIDTRAREVVAELS
jgi:hypothetical protein